MHPSDDTRELRATALEDIARLIARHVPGAGDHLTQISALSLHRRHAPTDPVPCIYPLGLVLIAQGAKQVLVGDRVLSYTPGQSMVVSPDLPIISHVTRATMHEPFLGLLLKLDVGKIADVASEIELPRRAGSHAPDISIEMLETALVDALKRMVGLLDEPMIARNLAPLIEREILVRLLLGPHGQHLRQLIGEESPGRQITRVVAWMKQNFASAFTIEDIGAGQHESHFTAQAFPRSHRNESVAIPQTVAAPGSTTIDVE